MERWKLWNKDLNTVEEIVSALSGLTPEELTAPKRNPYVPYLDLVAKNILEFIQNYPDAPVTILGDYDMDGMGSVSILKSVFKILTGKYPEVIIPDRVMDGYGFNPRFVNLIPMSDDGHGLLMVVDSGITAVEQVKAAKERGLTVLVIDHHLPLETGELPEPDVLVDPHCTDNAEFRDYCAAGLCYRLACMLVGEDHPELLAIAAVSTVADVVPMKGDNRNIVREGMQAIDAGANRALDILANDLGIEVCDEETLGFSIAPVFNAIGRMPEGRPIDAVTALVGDRKMEDFKIAELVFKFKELNEKRKAIEKETLKNLSSDDDDYPVIQVIDASLQGIAGILAGKCAEKVNMPAFCFARTDEGILKGSSRAGESGIHIKEMLDSVKDILITYGGHAKAAGLSLNEEHLEEFRKRCREYIDAHVKEIDGTRYFHKEITANTVKQVMAAQAALAPYGEGVPKPVYKITGVKLLPTSSGAVFRTSDKNDDWMMLHSVHADINSFDGTLKERWFAAGEPSEITVYGTLYTTVFRKKEYVKIRMIDFEYEGMPMPEEEEKKKIKKEKKDKEETMEKNVQAQAQQAPQVPVNFQDIPVGGSAVIVCMLLKVTEATTKNGDAYCVLDLSDKSGDKKSVKMWNVTKASLELQNVLPEHLYQFSISCELYQEERDYKIKGKTRGQDIMPPPADANVDDYIPCAPFGAQELYDHVLDMVNRICSEPLKLLVNTIYEKNREKLLYWAAATGYHHNYKAGLLWHMESMCESAYVQRSTNRFRNCNLGLVVAGCALHDIGKLQEMETSPLGEAVYTEAGNLFGHLLLGYQMVRDEAILLNIADDEEVKHLLHIIVSHHGNLEWGAITVPATKEADLVFHLDLIDSRNEMFVQEYKDLEPGQMAETRSRTLKRVVVRPSFA